MVAALTPRSRPAYVVPWQREEGTGFTIRDSLAAFSIAIYPIVLLGTIKTNVPQLALLFALAFGALVLNAPGALKHTRVSLPAIALLSWMGISATWASDTVFVRQGLFYSVLLPGTIMVLMASTASRLAIRSFLVGWYISLGITIVTTITMPEARLLRLNEVDALPSWHGLFLHKTNMVSALMTGVLILLLRGKRNLTTTLTFVVCGVLTIGSRSITGLAGGIAMIATWVWLGRFPMAKVREKSLYVATSLVLGYGGLLLGTSLLAKVLGFFGKDLTFTGRTQIWKAVVQTIPEHWWIGHGLRSTFSRPEAEPTATILRRIGFSASHSHNSVLQLLLDYGIIGVILTMIVLGSAIAFGWRRFRSGDNAGRAIIAWSAGLLMMAPSENVLASSNMMFLVMLVALAYSRMPSTVRTNRWR
jgi:O-antigen ligase